MTRVTVVIPAFNSRRTLGACLAGLGLERRQGRVRVIVADNGSTDGSRDVALSAGAEVLEVERAGPAAARNAGLAAAETEYVAFLDADCVPEAGWLDALVAGIDRSPHAGVGGRLRWTAKRAEIARFYNSFYPGNEESCRSDQAPYLLTANAIFRRAALCDVGGFDAAMPWCEDLELGVRLSKSGQSLGYALEAIVTLDAPESVLDRFSQFYKYGLGLDHVLRRHPGAVAWSARDAWHELLALTSPWPGAGSGSPFRSMALTARAGYLCGWLDARLRRYRAIWNGSSRPFLAVVNHCGTSGREAAVALSVDDGPDPETTCQMLGLLEAFRAKATFFVIGDRASRYPAQIEAIVAAGHEVYGHGYTHRRFDCLSEAEVRDELERTERLLRRVRPTPTPYLVRLPHGAGLADPHVHRAISGWRADCRIVHWSVDFCDWRIASRCSTLQDVLRECDAAVSTAFHREVVSGSILLLHERPVGETHSLVPAVSLTLLEKVLGALGERALGTIPLGRGR